MPVEALDESEPPAKNAGNQFVQAPALLGGNLEGLQLAVSHRVHDTWLLSRVMRIDAASAFRNIADAALGARAPYVDSEDAVQILPEGQREFTATAATDLINITAHGIPNGVTVQLISSGTLPGGLSPATTYYVRDSATNTLKLAATAGGGAIDITSAGTGTHTMVFVSTEESYTIGQYAPTFETFRTMQIVSNELMADSKVVDIVTKVMAGNIAESVQAYLIGKIGTSIATARHNVNDTTTGHASITNLLRLVSNIGTASVGGVAANTTLFNCEQRKRLVMASHSMHLSHFMTTNTALGSNNFHLAQLTLGLSDAAEEYRVPAPALGVPWYTDDSMPSATSGLAIAATPDIIAFDPTQVMLAEKPLVISLDTESRMAFNQTVIHATYRAAGALMHPKAAAGYSLYTRS